MSLFTSAKAPDRLFAAFIFLQRTLLLFLGLPSLVLLLLPHKSQYSITSQLTAVLSVHISEAKPLYITA